jgi:hypothetical protein
VRYLLIEEFAADLGTIEVLPVITSADTASRLGFGPLTST